MTLIKDILKLDLSEDIKNVIDLEDQSENEIQQEIEGYIVTEGLAKHLNDFIRSYQSNIKETGVWLSGFYGSGKSYFGKMLGYILANKSINGTPARDRFIPRLKGLKNEGLIENEMRGLDAYQSRVVLLDIAKQKTNNNLSFTLFKNFLKSLGFLPNAYGYWEYLLFMDNEYEKFKIAVKDSEGISWDEIRKNDRKVPSVMRRVLTKSAHTEDSYKETLDHLNNLITNFDAGKIKEELQRYLDSHDERIVFIFDEASEAIAQRKFDLLELEGISEALSQSSINQRVWTIAIAQEKLDTVITNANLSKSQLIKVTSRFKTKIPLESTEVDIIIRNRLLQKKDKFNDELLKYYKKNEGLIADATNLKSSFPTKTEQAEEFAIYYPFHKYQFDLLQKFLFSSNALVADQIAARGMIITTFDVLRKQLLNNKLFDFSTAQNICSEAQPAPPSDLDNKYSNAKKILKDTEIEGDELLKAIHFLSEAELVATTVENITKTYISDLGAYYEIKPKLEKALELLIEAKILLLSNNNYKITSDKEAKLLEEMNDFTVELFVKKRDLVNEFLKENDSLKSVKSIAEETVTYPFNLLTDLGDELFTSNNKKLKLTIYSLFSIHGDRQDFVEGLKMDKQFEKDNACLIPDNSEFAEIDKLMTEVKRFEYMEEKYSNDSDQVTRQIIRDFSIIKEEKRNDLTDMINRAYEKGSVIYLFDETLLNKDKFKGSVAEVQKKIVKNIYTKRLSVQLSESVGPQLMKEHNNEKLDRFFSGADFKFFDKKGNFIGDGLKVVEEVAARINKTFVDGKSLEAELLSPPTGYSYGTVSTTVATLFRAGKVIARFNGQEYFSYKDDGAAVIFKTGKNFQKASFKAISKSLTSNQKNKIVQALLDLKYQERTEQKVDWNTNDFELVDAIRSLADGYIGSLNSMRNTNSDFETLFPKGSELRSKLQEFTGKTTEANYIEKAEFFLENLKEYQEAIKGVEGIQTFIKRNLDKIKGYKRFVEEVANELMKSDVDSAKFRDNKDEFGNLYKSSLVEKFGNLQTLAQQVKDEYFELMKAQNEVMNKNYRAVKSTANALLAKLDKYPADLNIANKRKAKSIYDYASTRIHNDIKLEFQTACRNSGFTLSEMHNYNQLASQKETELVMIDANIVTEVPVEAVAPKPGASAPKAKPKAPRRIKLNVPKKEMTVKEYKSLLADQLRGLAGMDNDELVSVEID